MRVNRNKIESILAYHFNNPDFLDEAFTHSSFAYENKVTSNERLEFLGDSVLGFVISSKIFFECKGKEGELSRLRASIVSEEPLAFISENLGLDNYLVRGKGERKNGQVSKSMRADLVEAVIGAIFLDGGMECAQAFIEKVFASVIKQMERKNQTKDAKTRLQEKYTKQKIKYSIEKEGQSNTPTFVATVYINNLACGLGRGSTKREAEQLAAGEALKIVSQR